MSNDKGPPPIIATDGSGERHSDGYRHQWSPTHLPLSSSSQEASSSTFSKQRYKKDEGSKRNKESNVKRAAMEQDDEKSQIRSTYPPMFGTKQALSISLEKSDAIYPAPPVAVPSASSTSHFSLPQGFSTVDPINAFEQQEKVKVRLVENRGLVVEEADDDNDRSEGQGGKATTRDGDFRSRVDTRASYSLVRPSSSNNAAKKSVNCLKYGNRTTCPGHSSKIAASFNSRCGGGGNVRVSPPPFPPPPYFEGNEQQVNNNCGCGGSGNNSQQHGASSASSTSTTTSSFTNPFSKSRQGSGSAGISSLTPLMTGSDRTKDNHKIPVVVRSPSSSFKHAQGGSNIHLYCALVLGFSASLFFSLTLLLAKVLKNREHHPISIAFWRYIGVLIVSVPLGMIYIFRGKKNKVVGSVWPIHDMDKAATALALLMRGVLGSTAVILRFCSLKYLSISDAAVISYCAPVFAAIFAPFCVRKDKGGLVPILVGLIAAFGVFLVCRPPFLGGSVGGGGYNNDTMKGVFLASLSMLCTAGVLIVVRNLLQKVHFSLMMFVLGIWGVFEAGVLALSLDVLKVPELLPDIVMMFGVAILTFFGQLFVLLAIRMGQVGSAVSVMRSCDIFFSLLWQYLFLKTEPELYSILSAILIISAVWFICFRKWLVTLRENHLMRQRLSLMLY